MNITEFLPEFSLGQQLSLIIESGFRLITKAAKKEPLDPGVPPLTTAVWLSRGLVWIAR
jgi:hypothetical protein